ncbi:pre-mRNA-processing factor SLU7 [Fistulifera solaris]|uniref:Pre-mRNA-splicing factor SLU7 n=1 Tax=Fistulifera solaris TaxID=1519565 RepID=A0A1Z5JF31_FISSO|nr:pre-mRNA-processing factor SLU7 [Fistulifera solaris]|eukprot:GAX12620.1 pre-mRNA-processing factor SLU7 [Fistulifera solaris]
MASSNAGILEKQLQQARQAGTAAPAVDRKTGQMINPHNPEFLTKKPWYLSAEAQESSAPTLEHQQQLVEKSELTLTQAEELLEQQRQKERSSRDFRKGEWVEALKKNKLPYRICKIVHVNKKRGEYDLEYEDGSIEKSVKQKKGSERPRIRHTKAGNRSLDTSAMETFDSKRDQYHGYDAQRHNEVVTAKFEKREELRRQLREKAEEDTKEMKKTDSDFDDSDIESDNEDDDDDDEFAQRDEDAKVLTTRLARQGGVGGAQMKVTARNLRIREDTAKYLRNLDLNSAYYDPKSRSMRDNPNPEIPAQASEYAGDNFARVSGDAVGLAETQLFAWDAAEKGVSELHPQANPSQAELLKKQFKSKAANLKLEQKKAVLDRYGGSEYLDGTDGLGAVKQDKKPAAEGRKLRFGVTTKPVEYGPDGRPVGEKKVRRVAIPCKYEEDIFINGHTTVWGSYFHKGAFQWGYKDDHSLMKNSYCTGENGRIANDEANEQRYGTGVAGTAELAQARGMLKSMPRNERTSSIQQKSKLYGEADVHATLDEKKLKEALQRAQTDEIKDERKRKYNSMNAEVDISEEDMEAYRLTKEQKNDPMANIGTDELLDYR